MTRTLGGTLQSSAVGVPLLVALGALTMMGPFGTDAYLPALPTMAGDLDAGNGQVQLALTGFTLGMALGQLFTGPLSDGIGRRVPLLIGSAVMAIAGIGAAFAPDLPVLVCCCAAMGLGAYFGMVITRAVLSDLAEGAVLTRSFALLGTLTGLGPVLSPIFGVAVMALWGWRAIYLGLAVLSAICFLLVALLVPESLPAQRRVANALRALPRNTAAAFRSRTYLGGAIIIWFAFAGQFAYIAASAFLIQSVLGVSPLGYSIVFGINGAGLILAGLVTARLSGRWRERSIIALGLSIEGAGALVVLVTVLTGTVSAVTMLPALFLIGCSVGLVFGPSTTYALQGLRHAAGSALAVIGAVQFVGAGIVSPLVEIAGDRNPLPFAIVVSVAVVLAWTGWLVFRPNRPGAESKAEFKSRAHHGGARTTEGESHGSS